MNALINIKTDVSFWDFFVNNGKYEENVKTSSRLMKKVFLIIR